MSTTKEIAATFKAAVFAIPNKALFIKELGEGDQEKVRKLAESLCAANGATFDPENDILVELWFMADEPCFANMRGYFFNFKDEVDGRIWSGNTTTYWVPMKLVRDKKEGEVFNLKYPINFYCEEGGIPREMLLDMTVSVEQTLWRYRHFGNFEEVLNICLK